MARDHEKQDGPHQVRLFEAFLQLSTVEEIRRFLTDLCTPAELQAFSDRWRVAQLVDKEVPYRQIYEDTGVSTATVTRVARSLVYGDSGYRMVLDRLKEVEKKKCR